MIETNGRLRADSEGPCSTVSKLPVCKFSVNSPPVWQLPRKKSQCVPRCRIVSLAFVPALLYGADGRLRNRLLPELHRLVVSQTAKRSRKGNAKPRVFIPL